MRSKCFTGRGEELVSIWDLMRDLQAWISLVQTYHQSIYGVTHKPRVKFHKSHSLSYPHPRYLIGNFSFLPHSTQHHCLKHQPHLQQNGTLIPSKKTAWRVLEITRVLLLRELKVGQPFPRYHTQTCRDVASETLGWKGLQQVPQASIQGWPKRPEALCSSTTHPEAFAQLAWNKYSCKGEFTCVATQVPISWGNGSWEIKLVCGSKNS